MNGYEFNKVLDQMIDHCRTVLGTKADEYATEDRLHNFKRAAALKGETPRQALLGMMVKHTVSVYDLGMGADQVPAAVWDEKIGDHLNYLILLKALTIEEAYAPDGGNLPSMQEHRTQTPYGEALVVTQPTR